MRIFQVLPCLSYGDAIGNDVLALNNAIKKMGYDTGIYADVINERMKGMAETMSSIPCLSSQDIVIYHLAVASPISSYLKECKAKVIIIYHNITPAYFFEKYSLEYYYACNIGIKEATDLASVPKYCLADSDFNKNDLIKLGYKCSIDTLPILISFDDYKKEPNEEVIKNYKGDGYTNILFTGRIAPNKKHEDLIAAFYAYQKIYNKKSRLFLVGNAGGMDSYYDRLNSYIEILGVENVIFTNHIPFEDVLAYYHLADVFLCMSEHEGFCVPIVEAMFFDIPIIAYDCCAVGETMGESGIHLMSKDFVETAAIINRTIKDDMLRKRVIQKQRNRLEHFSNENVEKLFEGYMKKFIYENSL